MEISKETKSRIAQEAEAATRKFPTSLSEGGHDGYILGAEAEATRAEVLIDCLLKIRHNHYTENAVDKKIDEALSQYNNSK